MYSKRLLAMLLCISMLLAVFAVGVAAAGEEVYIEESVIVIEDGKVVSGDTSLIDSGIIVIGDDTSEEQSASTDTDCVYCEECEAYYTSSETVTETETENARLQVKDTVAVTDTSATSANTPDLTPKLTNPNVPGITTKYNRHCDHPNIIYEINPNASTTTTAQKNEFNWRRHRLAAENITIAMSQIVELQFAKDITEFTYELAYSKIKMWRYKNGSTVFLAPMFYGQNGKTFNIYGNNDNFYAANQGSAGLGPIRDYLYLDGRFTKVDTSTGDDPTSIDSSTNAESPLIYVEAGGTIKIWDTYLRYNRNKAGSAVYSKKGGAAYVAGTLYIESSTIQNCTADYGGGIYVANGGNLELNGVTIQNCTSTYGGAIYVEGNATLKFKDVNVIKNSATYGGGLYINNGFSATISDTNDLVIGGSDANKNTATYGGGIYVNSGTVSLNNVQVNYNTASAENGSGGGIYINGGNVTVKGASKINNNAAYNNGGAICVKSGAGLTVAGTTEIKNNELQEYIAPEASRNLASEGKYKGTGTVLSSTADTGGSWTSYHSGGKLVDNNTAFRVSTYVRFYAGDLYTSNDAYIVFQFDDEIKVDSVELYMFDSASVPSNYNVGSMRYPQSVTVYTNDTGDYSSLTSNEQLGTCSAGSETKAYYEGGSYYYSYRKIYSLTNTTEKTGKYIIFKLRENATYLACSEIKIFGAAVPPPSDAVTYGGGIYNEGTATVSGSTVIDSNTATYGGGVFSNNAFTMSGGEISNHTSTQGAGVYVEKGTLEVTGGKIHHNVATDDGGGIVLMNSAGASTATIGGGTTTAQIYNNTANNRGGGIRLYGSGGNPINVTIKDNAKIYSNEAKSTGEVSGGGGVFVGSNGNVDMQGGEIYQNKAYNGAGIVAYGGTVKISGNSKIYKNEASNSGGGVYIEGYATLNITGSSTVGATNIYENTADYRGGGIYIYEPELDNSISIKNVTIDGNSAIDNRGGGLYVNYHLEKFKNYSFYMENAVISNNEADTNGDTSIDGHGGGIYLCACVATFKNCTFSGNSTNKLGGGLYATQWMVVSMSDCTFTGNSVEDGGDVNERGCGGGLYAYQDAKITAVRCTFTGNSARSGAAIGTNGYIYQGVEYLTELNLVDCTIGTNAEGGRNTASHYGGGIYSYSGSKINIVRGTVQNNGAENGAGIYVTNSNVVLNISDSTSIIDGFSMEGVAATGDGTVISDNEAYSADSAYGSGGGIYCGSGTTLSVTNAKILRNTASYNGGGVAISSQLNDTSKTVFTGTEIDGNTARSKGGGIMFYRTPYTLTDCVIGSTEGNSVTDNDGGGICVIANSGDTFEGIINGGEFNKNSAYHGGGIYTQAKLTVSDISVNDNYARGHGGGIYTTNVLTITDITVERNHSLYDGGGLCIGHDSGATGTATISGSNLFKGNSADGYGGAIIVHPASSLTINGNDTENTVVTENKITALNENIRAGAGIHVATEATLNMTYGKITDNHSDKDKNGNATRSHGGGLDITGGTVTISHVEISGNVAGGHGGGIRVCHYLVPGNLTVTNCEIKDNVSGQMGGGVAVYGATANITDTTIDNNEAQMGGGVGAKVYTDDNTTYGTTVNVKDSYITNNRAVGDFGGVTTAVSGDVISGAGGGVAVSDKSTFKLELTDKSGAIYGNTATTAGDDVFSNGINTDLTIPQPEEMDTTGFGAVKAYWFEDYMANDSQYTSKGLNGSDGAKPVRYKDALVSIRAYTSSAEGTATNNRYINDDNRFVAITFGIEKFNVGSIKITAPTVADTNQMFVFVIHGTTAEGNVITVDVSVKAGQTVEVSKLMAGEYTVVMDADWSWRYTVNGITVDGANKGTGMVEVEIVGRADEEHTVVYTALINENKWLTHNSDRKTNTASPPQVAYRFDMTVYDKRQLV